jgi:alcohol dehydrogenase (cytochrome c)
MITKAHAAGMLIALGVAGAAHAQSGPTQEELNAAASGTDWILPHHDYAGTRWVDLKQITPANAANLRPICMYQGADMNRSLNNPLVYRGVMYVTTTYATAAVDPLTCRAKWRHEWKLKGKEANTSIKNRGVAIKDGVLVRGTQDGWLFALDAQTGKVLWEVQAADAQKYEALSMSPLVFEDLVIVGPSGSEYGVRGWVGAFRLKDGQPVWRFNTIPGEGEAGYDTWGNADANLRRGGGLWTTPALDEKTGEVFVAVGNPAPDFHGSGRMGENLYTNALLVLDARTGRYKWHKQATPHDTHDWDMPVATPLLSGQFGGKQRDVVTLGGKDGFMRLVDRSTHEQLWAVPVTTIKNADQEPTEDGIHACPGYLGGVEWNGPAYVREHDLLVIPAVDWCGVYKKEEEARFVAGQLFMGGSFTPDPVDKSTGWLTAVKASTGEVAWKYHSARPMVAAVTATSGGVLFTGELTGDFLTLEAASGKVLYRFNAGGAIVGGVITYAVNGKQYVAVVSGQAAGFWLAAPGAWMLTVFALP